MSGPLEATPHEDTAEPAQLQPSEPRPRQHLRLSIVAGASVMTALVVLFAALFSAFNNRSIVSGGAPPLSPVPAGWQRYTDPGGLFTVSFPKGWTVEQQRGSGVEGSSHGSVTFDDTMNAFGGPPHGQNTITVFLYVQPLESDLARQLMCDFGFHQHTNTTLAGLPAWHDSEVGWLVDSYSAHFQINYTYPNDKGDVMIPANAPSPTPMPPGFYERGQQEVQTMLASFMPTPDTPLTCS